MKAFFILIISFFLAVSAFGQQDYPDSGFTNKAEAKNLGVNGSREGKWVEYFKHCMYVHDDYLTDDTNCEYYRLTIYKNDTIEGIVRDYAKPKVLLREIPYKNDKKNGIEKVFRPDGTLRVEVPFKDGKVNGMIRHYNREGKISHEESYTNDILNGMAKSYYDNGVIQSEAFWVNGTDTLNIRYDENGVEKKRIKEKNH